MATWIGVVPNVGKALFATWVSGTTFNFDSAEGGTGTVPEASLLAQTALVNKKQDISIISGERVGDGLKLTVQITAPATGYTLNQIGIKGSVDGGAKTLTALFQTADGVTIPSAAQTPDFIYKFFGTVQVTNTGTFTLTIDTSAVVAQSTLDEALNEIKESATTLDDLNTAIAIHDTGNTAHSDIRAALYTFTESIPNNYYTKPQADQRISDDIYAHNTSGDAHGDIRAGLSAAESRIASLEIIVGGGIATNPFIITFATLAGTTVTGVWNNTQGRIEF